MGWCYNIFQLNNKVRADGLIFGIYIKQIDTFQKIILFLRTPWFTIYTSNAFHSILDFNTSFTIPRRIAQLITPLVALKWHFILCHT